jgi:hypothetical protein
MTTFVLSMINANAVAVCHCLSYAASRYASFGAVVNSTFGRTVVPLFALEESANSWRSTF